MSDTNRLILVGRCTKKAELTYTQNGYALCKISLASNRKRKDGDKWIDEASFFDVVLWGKQGESLSQYLLKGQQIAVDGSIKQDRWEQDGQKRSRVVIEASNIQLLGGQKQSGTQEYSQARQEPVFKDDIPF